MTVDLSQIWHKHMTQRVSSDPYWKVNCTAYCLAMALTDATLGGLHITGRQVRAMSSEPAPDPSSPGLNVQQMEDVARKLRVDFYNKAGESWDTMRNRVGSGASRAILQIDYSLMAGHACQTNLNIKHAILLIAFDGKLVRASDPLCPVTKWYPADTIRQAAEAFTVGGGVSYGVTRPVPKYIS